MGRGKPFRRVPRLYEAIRDPYVDYGPMYEVDRFALAASLVVALTSPYRNRTLVERPCESRFN